MTENFDRDISFFDSSFTDQVYRIRPNKYNSKVSSNTSGGVREETLEYNYTQNLQFSGITSPTLLLFNYPNEDAIPLEDKAFLDQVLKAAGLAFENLSRLYLGHPPLNISWKEIAAQSASDFVIAFGVDQAYLPDGIGEGRIYNINNKRVLCSSSLSELSTNSSKKKLLWQGLKEIYGL